jgi:putative transposase
VKARHNYRIYPTPEQVDQLARTFGCTRLIYNWGLALRAEAYRNGAPLNYAQTSAALTKLKQTPERAFLNEVSCIPLQQSLRDLQSAYVSFFEKRTGYPRFRRKDGPQSAEYTANGFGFDAKNRTLSLAKIGRIKVKWSRDFLAEPSSLRVLRDPAGRYFVSMVVDVAPVKVVATGENVGVDFGLNRLATLSTGERVPNPKHSYRLQRRMALLQRRLAKKIKGSNRRKLAVLRVAKLHAKIADTRKDAAHKLTTNLVRRFDTICIEDLNLRGMVKNHSLARSVSDAGIGMLSRMLVEKGERYGRTVVKIDRWFPSSKTCSACGDINAAVVLGVKDWTCPSCAVHHDRDDNAAKNILAVGLTVAARGGTVRPSRAPARNGKSLRSVNHPVNACA